MINRLFNNFVPTRRPQSVVLPVAGIVLWISAASAIVQADEKLQPEVGWTKVIVCEGEACTTAVAADYTKDGIIDVIADTGNGVTRLLIGPDWKQEVVLDDDHKQRYIH
ncbi:MAG: hypothetical protein KDA89_12315, partial [Planctomycetaceae bacterium]|nr:hypothetical protein [Planctomycetaceae bacterium]